MSGLISIVVPVYNVEQYLRDCLDSVLKQNYQDYEIILVNDGSTDNSVKICEEYIRKDNRIHLINQKNAGASAARNKGMRYASGKYLYFLDSDDWLEEDTLEKLVQCITVEQADMIFFDAYAVDETKGIKSEKYYSHKQSYKSASGPEMMTQLLQNKEFHVTPWHMFFKREFLNKKQICFEEGIIYEDMIFAYQVFCEARKVAYLPEFLYSRRFRADSVMTSKVCDKNFESALKVYYCVKTYSEKIEYVKKNNNYIVRCAYNGLNVYKCLDAEGKKTVHGKYVQLKKDILLNNAFGDVALKLYCYNKVLWIIYKVIMKLYETMCRKAK